MNENIIRNLIREIIKEAVKTNELKNLYLWVNKRGNSKNYILFHSNFERSFIDNINQLTSDNNKDFWKAIDNIVHDSTLAIIDTDKNSDCYEAEKVYSAAAVKGWGPTIYDIAMSMSPTGLIGDRSSVSKDAYSVWDYYKEKRTDVNKKPLDWNRKKWTKKTEDDCNAGSSTNYLRDGRKTDNFDIWKEDALSWVYNKDKIPEVEICLDNMVTFLSNIQVPYEKIKKIMRGISYEFFGIKY